MGARIGVMRLFAGILLGESLQGNLGDFPHVLILVGNRIDQRSGVTASPPITPKANNTLPLTSAFWSFKALGQGPLWRVYRRFLPVHLQP